jgi:NitT/TauT family transport system substrate-binding protein
MYSRAAFLGSAGAAAVAATVPPAAVAQSDQIRMSGVFSDLFAEPFYASGAGAFAKRGFAVTTTSLNNAGAVVAAIGGGSLELGTGDLVSGINAIIAGVPIVLIAGGGLYRSPIDAPTAIIAVAQESPIKTAADLVGKSIGVPTLVGLTTASLRAWLPEHGVPLESVKLVEIPASAGVPAVVRGTIDATMSSEPFVTMSKGLIRSVGYPYDAIAEHAPTKQFCVSVWYASKPWIDQDRARARRALQAIYDTAAWANTHHDETFDILVQNGHLDADKIRGIQRVQFATSLTPDAIAPVVAVATQAKLFPKPVDVSTLITTL